jgi:hypothetical protein
MEGKAKCVHPKADVEILKHEIVSTNGLWHYGCNRRECAYYDTRCLWDTIENNNPCCSRCDNCSKLFNFVQKAPKERLDGGLLNKFFG